MFMRGVHDFIIKIDREFNDTLETESGVVLYADKSFSQDKLANRIATVVETPLTYSGEIQKGFELFIDHSLFLRETYKHGTVENIYTIDAEKGLYKIPEDLIYMYKVNGGEWIGYNDNLMVGEEKENTEEEKIGSIIVATKKQKRVINRVIVANDSLSDLGVSIGDSVLVDEKMKMPVPYNGKTCYLLTNKYIFAVYESRRE